jgi:hypothetical protein
LPQIPDGQRKRDIDGDVPRCHLSVIAPLLGRTPDSSICGGLIEFCNRLLAAIALFWEPPRTSTVRKQPQPNENEFLSRLH